MDDMHTVAGYYESLKEVPDTTPQAYLSDEIVWLEMYKAFVNWHAVSRTPGIIYSEAADKALIEFKKRFRQE